VRLSARLYRWLLKLYPAGFREDYGTPLQRQFTDDYAEVRGVGGQLRFWLRTLVDLARSLPIQLGREVRQDARHTLRLWRRRPLHTAFAIAVLTIAIGANTGVFSVLNALLLRSLPFHQPERLATMRMFLPGGLGSSRAFHEWRQKSSYAATGFTYTSNEVNLDDDQHAARVRLTEASWNFFDVIGTPPAQGRAFVEGEDKRGSEAVAVIGHGLWQQMYGGAAGALGSTIRVNGVPLTIVGIAPPGFDYPRGTAVWSATVFDPERIPKTTVSFWTAVARLKDGVTWPQARQAFETEAYAESPERRQADLLNRPALIPLREELAGPVRQASFVLMAGAALLLLLACANLASFLLAHTLAREQELMIRAALGASRARLTQQLLTETVLLSLIAAAAGLAVAWWTTGAALAFQPAPLASQAYSVLDWQVLAFAALLSVGTGLLFGAGPVVYVSRRMFAVSARTATPARRHTRLRNALIFVQVAVTIVLVTASAALGRTFLTLLRVDNGYALETVATMSVSFAGTPYAGARTRVYYDLAAARLSGLPGVTSVSATQFLPLGTEGYGAGRFNVDGAGAQTLATTVPVHPGYFATLGGQVLAGREFTPQDVDGTESIAIVNEEFARVFADHASIVGRMITSTRLAPRRIIGVVRGMRDSGPLYPPSPQIFLPSRTPRALTFVVRVAGPAAPHIAAIRDALASVDARVPVFNVRTMDQWLEQTLARPKFYAMAVLFFGGLALLLSVIGVYGVVSYACGERIRELGIRLALGTTPVRLRGVLVWRIVLLVAAGAAAGGLLAGSGGRYLRDLIPGAEAAIVATVAIAILGTLIVAVVATWAATRRVAHLDLMRALRPE
jgi:putative ABC transport system permease protein